MRNIIAQLLAEMTLEEKASLLSGKDFWHTKPIERLGVPSVLVTDGPHGLRKENDNILENDSVALKESYPATCFPTAATVACSWDRALSGEIGKAIAQEAKDQEITTVLGPGVNIKRSPLCGRNFEYYSEDPYLSGELASSFIKGVQKNKIGTSLKHYCANNQEYLRMTINSVVDERALREIYLPAFEHAVKDAKPYTVMCSYNKLNGTYLSDSKKLLNDILRDEWGFKGIVVSDWGATNKRVKGVVAGMDLEMPATGGVNDKAVVKAVKKGKLEEEALDKMVERLLEFIFNANESVEHDYHYDYTKSHKLARKAAANSAVLLKNSERMLPLSKSEDVAIIGRLAKDIRYQGSGSSRINPVNLVNFINFMNNYNIPYEYCDGYNMSDDGYDKNLINEAVALAAKKEKVIVFVGLTDSYESEGYDRKHIDLPHGHNTLIDEIAKVNENITVVLLGGSAITMPWIDKVKSVIHFFLGGEAVGEAIGDVLFGDVTPSGKLSETYPIKLADHLSTNYFHMGPKNVEYRESIYVGYRYFDSAKKDVFFPFGYGLSYTTFEYSDCKLDKSEMKDNETVTVSVTVTNTGKVAGSEIVQVYVRDKESTIYRPDKELKNFEKVSLKPGESKTIEMKLSFRAFSYYNVNISDWHVESGEFEILVGASSRDIKAQLPLYVHSTNPNAVAPDYRNTAPSYYDIENTEFIPDSEFETVYGSKLPPNIPPSKGEFDSNSTVWDIRKCLIGKAILKFGPSLVVNQIQNVDQTTLLAMQSTIEEIPLRGFYGFTGGIMTLGIVDGIIMYANGKRLRGLWNIIKDIPKCLENLNAPKKLAREYKKAQQKALKEKLKQQGIK